MLCIASGTTTSHSPPTYSTRLEWKWYTKQWPTSVLGRKSGATPVPAVGEGRKRARSNKQIPGSVQFRWFRQFWVSKMEPRLFLGNGAGTGAPHTQFRSLCAAFYVDNTGSQKAQTSLFFKFAVALCLVRLSFPPSSHSLLFYPSFSLVLSYISLSMLLCDTSWFFPFRFSFSFYLSSSSLLYHSVSQLHQFCNLTFVFSSLKIPLPFLFPTPLFLLYSLLHTSISSCSFYMSTLTLFVLCHP